jgi:uncharacterized membrane protein
MTPRSRDVYERYGLGVCPVLAQGAAGVASPVRALFRFPRAPQWLRDARSLASSGGSALGWLAARTREPRLLVPAVGGVGAALIHGALFDSPPTHFFTARSNPATGVPALLIVAIGAAVIARFTRETSVGSRRLRNVSWWSSGVVIVYALSLSILELLQKSFPHASLHTDFQRGHTAVSAFWGLLGLILLYLGLTRWRSLRIAGFALFAVSLAKIFLYDLPSLSSITRALSFLAVGAVLLLGGFFYQRFAASQDEQTDLIPRVET